MIIAMRTLLVIGVLTLCVGLFIVPLTAQANTLSGEIKDKSDGTSLAGATVTVKPADPEANAVATAADRMGKFEVKNLPPGRYSVQISSVGFATETIGEVIIAESDDKVIDVELRPAAVNLDAVSVTASRRPEKILNTPAAVTVVGSETIEARTTLTLTDHLKGLPAVDVASTGLNQSNVVVRGFNNIFSGALLVLTDNRIARVPSLRFNAYNFIPTINEDIERIEIVSGPGSALYGPNAASGVMHMVTKSPFSSRGTTISLGGGERDLMLGAIRHAGTITNSIGYKITGQYYQGKDWQSYEPAEPDSIQKFRPTADGPEPVGEMVINTRDRDIEKFAGEGRMDFLIDKDMTLILNGGLSQASSIELTGLGAAQAVDWIYSFAQARLRYKDLFVQGFVNMSDAGDTYLLSTGQLIVDKSKLWGAQVQHRYEATEKLSLTYGFDALLTRPDTDQTINGKHEADDNINEYGVYLQSDLVLTEALKFVAAARVDDHNHLEDPVFSPRAALVYNPRAEHNFRLTYNRAFSTPDNNNLFLDILQTNDMKEMGASFNDFLGFAPEIDIRVQGVPESGFHWSWNDGMPQYRTPFAQEDLLPGMTNETFIDFNNPNMTDFAWGLGRGVATQNIANRLIDSSYTQAEVNDMLAALAAVNPAAVSSDVSNILMTVNPDLGIAEPSTISDIADISRLEPTITQTFELGYKGVVNDKFRFSVDLYRTEKNNFIGPLTVETPNVFLNPSELQNYLAAQYTAFVMDHNNAAEAAVLAELDNPDAGGNGNGNPIDELVTQYTTDAASIPFGTVTPIEAYDPTAVLVTYRNFGDISFYGADLAFAYHLNQNWNFGANYSYVSKNFFEKSDEQVHDIHLNAPKHKAGVNLQYINPQWGLDLNARYRFVDAFDMDSPFYGSSIKAYQLVDVNVGQKFIYDTRLSVTVQNLFDKKHVEFIGGPELGRLAIMRLTRSF